MAGFPLRVFVFRVSPDNVGSSIAGIRESMLKDLFSAKHIPLDITIKTATGSKNLTKRIFFIPLLFYYLSVKCQDGTI
jgi:hypothetical protein